MVRLGGPNKDLLGPQERLLGELTAPLRCLEPRPGACFSAQNALGGGQIPRLPCAPSIVWSFEAVGIGAIDTGNRPCQRFGRDAVGRRPPALGRVVMPQILLGGLRDETVLRLEVGATSTEVQEESIESAPGLSADEAAALWLGLPRRCLPGRTGRSRQSAPRAGRESLLGSGRLPDSRRLGCAEVACGHPEIEGESRGSPGRDESCGARGLIRPALSNPWPGRGLADTGGEERVAASVTPAPRTRGEGAPGAVLSCGARGGPMVVVDGRPRPRYFRADRRADARSATSGPPADVTFMSARGRFD